MSSLRVVWQFTNTLDLTMFQCSEMNISRSTWHCLQQGWNCKLNWMNDSLKIFSTNLDWKLPLTFLTLMKMTWDVWIEYLNHRTAPPPWQTKIWSSRFKTKLTGVERHPWSFWKKITQYCTSESYSGSSVRSTKFTKRCWAGWNLTDSWNIGDEILFFHRNQKKNKLDHKSWQWITYRLGSLSVLFRWFWAWSRSSLNYCQNCVWKHV